MEHHLSHEPFGYVELVVTTFQQLEDKRMATIARLFGTRVQGQLE